MSTRYTAAEWEVWLEEYRHSGLTVKEFCELLEVSIATFYNWQRKLSNPAIEPNIPDPFVPVSLVGDTVEIRLPAGAIVKLSNDTESLRPILQVLAEIGASS